MSEFSSQPPTSITFDRSRNEHRAKIFAALSDPTRLQIVEMLATYGEMSGSDVAQQLGISLSLFCHHSKNLSEAGVLQIRREGQTKYHSLNLAILKDCFASFQI